MYYDDLDENNEYAFELLLDMIVKTGLVRVYEE
jgi:hypothetical protein